MPTNHDASDYWGNWTAPPFARFGADEVSVPWRILLVLGVALVTFGFRVGFGQLIETVPSFEGSILDAAPGESAGYRWQICSHRASYDIEGVTSGSWTNESFGVADLDREIFVTEVISVELGEVAQRTYRIDSTGEFKVLSNGGGFANEPDGWHEFQNQYGEHLELDGLSQRDVEFYTRIDQGFPEHHVDGLRTLDGVIVAFRLEQDSATTEVDKAGAEFRRYELPAFEDPQAHPDLVDWGAQQLGFFGSVRGTSWVLDVWMRADGTVERLRLQTQEFAQHWTELRFVDGGLTTELPSPNGPNRLGYGPSCPTGGNEFEDLGWMGFEPWQASVATPVDASIDPEGRPYDATDYGGTILRRELGTLIAIDRAVYVTDAWVIPSDLASGPAIEAVTFDGAPPGDISLQATLLATTDDESTYEQAHGIRLDVAGGSVENWTAFETGYCTDGGTGRISSYQSLELTGMPDDEVFEETAWIGDLDRTPGHDTIIFSNGWGDGCFPMSRGLDSNGDTVSLVVWDPHYPWRLMIPDGVPPREVTDRENEIQACIDGKRRVEAYGFCFHES